MSQSSRERRRGRELARGAFGVVDEGPDGVGGCEGRRKAGRAIITDFFFGKEGGELVGEFVRGRLVVFVGGEGKGMNTYDNSHVEHGIGHLGRVGSEEGNNELTERGAERVRKARQGSSGDTTTTRKPEIGVARGRAQDKGLREADEDLAEHDDAVDAAVARVRAGDADDVAENRERRGRHHRRLRPPVQHVDGQGGDGDEGEEEGRREPVYV